MRKLLLSLLIFLSVSTAHATGTPNEVLNSNDPNYQIELNDMLQTIVSGLTQLDTSAHDSKQLVGLIQASQGGTGIDSSNWPSGDLPYMSSTGVWGHQPIGSFSIPWVPHNIQVFTTSGTWTKPAGIVNVYVKAWGGGGAGGSGRSSVVAAPGGGGGGGGYSEGTIAVTTNVTVTVGTGGIYSPGAAASASTFAGTTTLTAGAGGVGGNASSGTQGTAGSGGTSSGGTINITGQSGLSNSWGGGSFQSGIGGNLATSSIASGDGYFYGAGGGGGNATFGSGGNGANGVVIVYY